MKQILKVLVGSKAHGIASPESDSDYRGVFILPTDDFFKIDHKPEITSWLEGETKDDVSWEVGHFLSLALKCHPNIMDVFMSPSLLITAEGQSLLDLFPSILDRDILIESFLNYGENNRKKCLDNKDGCGGWFAATHLRTLYNAYELLQFGRYKVDLAGTEVFEVCKMWKSGRYNRGDVINLTDLWIDKVEYFKGQPTRFKQDKATVEQWLINVRKSNWS